MRKRVFWTIPGVFALLFLINMGNVWSQESQVASETPLTIMRPDPDTLHQWIEDYEAAQPAELDEGIAVGLMESEMLNVSTPVSLLSHLKYTPVERNQGNCGDCWVWAGTGVMEVALDVQNSIKDRLSIQFLNSCKSDSFACCGGNLSGLATWYNSAGKAIPWSNNYASFQDAYSQCGDSSAVSCGNISNNPAYTVKSIAATRIATNGYDGVYDQATAIANIKNVLNQGKAIYFSYHLADNTDWDAFRNFWRNQSESDIWDPDVYCGHTWNTDQGGGHAVLIVGYDDSGSTPYWLVLNSWGTTASRPNGLFRLKMNMNYGCIMHETGYGDWYSRQFWTLNAQFGNPPGKPTPISPSLDLPPSSNKPAYTWSPAANDPQWYYLYVVDKTGSPVHQWVSSADAGCSGGLGTCSFTPGVAVWAGNASWCVVGYNGSGWGPWSEWSPFKVPGLPARPTQVSPSIAIPPATNLPTYTWNADPLSTWYYLYATDSKGGVVLKWYSPADAGCPGGTGNCSVTPPTAFAEGSANWWLVGWNSYGYGDWGGPIPFQVPAPVYPGKPTQISPSAGALPNNFPPYTWDADANSQWYQLYVIDSTGVGRINTWYSAADAGCPNGTGTCSVAPLTALATGSFNWWLVGWNPNGYGAWSGPTTFNVSTSPKPNQVTLISPSMVIPPGTNMPTYTWNAVPNCPWYWLYVVDGTGVARVNSWYSASQSGCSSGSGICSVTPGTALTGGAAYTWYIDGWNPNGYGPWSLATQFTTP